MVEFFRDELFLRGSFSIHWLIWIQLLLFILLIYALYAVSSSSSNDGIFTPPVNSLLTSSTAVCSTTIASTSSSTSDGYRQEEESEEEDRKLDKRKDGFDGGVSAGLTEVIHPCHIVRLARMAFLRCFGLGPPTDNPTCREVPPRR